MPFSKAALVNGPGPSIIHAESSGPQLLEYMPIISSLCTKAADSVASVASFTSSKKRMPNRREYGIESRCFPHERNIIQIHSMENVLPSYLHPYLNPCYSNPFKVCELFLMLQKNPSLPSLYRCGRVSGTTIPWVGANRGDWDEFHSRKFEEFLLELKVIKINSKIWMLELVSSSSPNLTWRDAQHIIANSPFKSIYFFG